MRPRLSHARSHTSIAKSARGIPPTSSMTAQQRQPSPVFSREAELLVFSPCQSSASARCEPGGPGAGRRESTRPQGHKHTQSLTVTKHGVRDVTKRPLSPDTTAMGSTVRWCHPSKHTSVMAGTQKRPTACRNRTTGGGAAGARASRELQDSQQPGYMVRLSVAAGAAAHSLAGSVGRRRRCRHPLGSMPADRQRQQVQSSTR